MPLTKILGASLDLVPALLASTGPSKTRVLAPQREACTLAGSSVVSTRVTGWQTWLVQGDAEPVAGAVLPIGMHECGAPFRLRAGPSVLTVAGASPRVVLGWADGATLNLLGTDEDGSSE